MTAIKDLLYVRFEIEDLVRQTQFLTDFGFEVSREENRLLARGYDSAPYIYIAEKATANLIMRLSKSAIWTTSCSPTTFSRKRVMSSAGEWASTC